MTAAKTSPETAAQATKKKPPAANGAEPAPKPFRERLRLLYHGHSIAAHRFRYGLLALDVVIIAFIIATSFIPDAPWIIYADVIFGLVILAEFPEHQLDFPSQAGIVRIVLHVRTRVRAVIRLRPDKQSPLRP